MHIQLTGHHVELTPALKELTDKKFSKIERHYPDIQTLHVTFSVEKIRHKAEAHGLHAGKNIHAQAESNDLYSAIDELIAKLERQLAKHKGKNT